MNAFSCNAGLLAARQVPWLGAILSLFDSASKLSFIAIEYAVKLACTPANIDQVVSAGLQLESPASRRKFFKQVCIPFLCSF